MNGLFFHWSRGWGVLSFSERLVISHFIIHNNIWFVWLHLHPGRHYSNAITCHPDVNTHTAAVHETDHRIPHYTWGDQLIVQNLWKIHVLLSSKIMFRSSYNFTCDKTAQQLWQLWLDLRPDQTIKMKMRANRIFTGFQLWDQRYFVKWVIGHNTVQWQW